MRESRRRPAAGEPSGQQQRSVAKVGAMALPPPAPSPGAGTIRATPERPGRPARSDGNAKAVN